MGLTIDDLMAAPLFGANRHILEYDELVYAIPRNVTKEDLSASHAAGLPLERERIIRCKDCKFYDEIVHACEHPNITAFRGDIPINYILTCFDDDFCCWAKPRRDDELDAHS